jgi:hypothetical protein
MLQVDRFCADSSARSAATPPHGIIEQPLHECRKHMLATWDHKIWEEGESLEFATVATWILSADFGAMREIVFRLSDWDFGIFGIMRCWDFLREQGSRWKACS